MALFQLKTTQVIPANIDVVWNFISSPRNLKEITPDYMGFDITSHPTDKMYPGQIIKYEVSPLLGIKMNWVTEITHVRNKRFFVDEQRMGPYKIWHHQHHLEETEEGVKMTDIVSYAPPFGILGKWLNRFVIRKKLNEIFEYRHKKIEEMFHKNIT